MTGEAGTRRRPYHGRTAGRGRGKGSSGKTDNPPRKGNFVRTDNLFHPHGIGRNQQSATYGTVKSSIVHHVKSTFDHGMDIGTSLRDLFLIDFDTLKPKRERSTIKDADDNKFEQESMDMEYRNSLSMWRE